MNFFQTTLKRVATASAIFSMLLCLHSAQAQVWDASMSTTTVPCYRTGNVGIGTTNPSTTLHLNGHFLIERNEGAYVDTRAKIIISGSSTPGLRFQMTDDNGSNYDDALFLAENTKVGIGTTTPDDQLHVEGNLKVESGITAGRSIRAGHDGANAWLESDYGKIHLNYVSNNDVAIGNLSATQGTRSNLTVAGNVLIGDPCVTNGEQNLTVSGNATVHGYIHTTEVEVKSTWCDYVFDEDYELMPLEDVRAFIVANGHLPKIPSAAEVESKGLAMADMQRRMMEKIEELTLHLIEMDRKISDLEAENTTLRDNGSH